MAKALNVSVAVTADTAQARAALQQLQATLTSLTTTSTNFTLGGSIKQEAVEASKAIAQLQSQLKEATNVQTGNLDLTKFNQSMKNSNMSLEKYRTALQSMGTTGQQAFAQLANSISQAEVPLRRSNAMLREFGTTIANTARWQLSSSIIHGMMGAIQQAYGYAQNLNKSLNNIQVVTGLSDTKMAQFAESANKAAKSLSTTTTSYTDAALIYYQQGIRDQNEIAQRVETTIKLANVSGQSAEKVSNQMTAIWNNFDDGTKSLEYYADVITALGAATASSSEEIATGLSKFASVADTVGLSYENATAALATITATTRQSADSVGTGLRTLFARLQSLKLGETLEDGVDLTKYTKALKTIGVDVLDAAGNMRQMDDILDDMGAKWQNLTDAQKTATAQTVGGVRQYTTLMALMENFDFYKENQQVALGSSGTVQKQADIYAKSWEAAQKRVRASAQSIYSDLIDDKFFISLNNGFAKFLDQIHNSIQAFGGLKGILLGIGTLITTVFANKAATGLQNFVDNIKMLTPGGRQQVLDLRRQGSDMLVQNAGQGNDFMNQTMSNAYAQQGQLQNAYLANAERMSAEQQNIAQAMMQQQQILIKNVQLSAEQVQQARQQTTQESINAKKVVNQNIGNVSRQANMKSQIDLITQEAKNVGKIDQFLSVFDGAKVSNIDQVSESIKRLGLSAMDFESYAPGAGQAFSQLMAAMKMDDADPKKLEEVQKALDKLNTIRADGQGGAQLDAMTEHLKTLANTHLPKEEYEAFCNSLDHVISSAHQAGAAEMNLGNAEGQLTGFTKVLSAAMDELATKQYSTAQAIVNLAGALSSIAMIINNLRNLSKTWSDDSLSFGDKLLSTFTTLGPTLMMATNGITKLLPSIIKLGSGISSILPGFGSLGTAAAGLAGKLGLISTAANSAAPAALASATAFAGFAAILIGVGAAAYYIAEAIETPKERLKRLTTEAENSSTAADEAKQAYQNLLSLKSQHNELLDTLNSLTEGTLEFRDALVQANDVARQIIAANNFQYGVDYSIKNGRIEFNEESLKLAEERAIAIEEATSRGSAVADALKEGAANAIDERSAINKATTTAQRTTGSYTNLITTPNIIDIQKVLGKDMTENGYNAFDLQSLLASSFSSPMTQYYNWLEQGNQGKYSDFYNQQQALGQKSLDDYNDNEIDQYYMNQNMWENLRSYTPEFMTEILGNYLSELFPKGATLESIAEGMQGEYFASNHPWEGGTRQVNTAFSGIIGSISSEKDLGLAGELATSALVEKYSNDVNMKALEATVDAEIKALGDDKAKLEDAYRELYNLDENAVIPEMDTEQIKKAIKEQKIYQHWVTEFEEQSQSYAVDSVQKYEDFADQTGSEINQSLNELQGMIDNPTLDESTRATAQAYKEHMLNQVKDSFADLSEAVLATGADSDIFSWDTNAENARAISRMSINQRKAMASAITSMTSTFGQEAGAIFRDELLANPALVDTLKDIDLSSKTAALASIKKSTDFSQDLYNQMLQGVGGKKGLFEDLYGSEEFADNLKTLQKSFKKTGRIGGKEILEMAEDSEFLNDWLESTDITAQGLADTLESMEMGDISLASLTSELLEANSLASTMENNLALVFQHIDKFQKKRSTKELGDFYGGLGKDIKEGITEGRVADPLVQQAFGELFGTDRLGEYMNDMANWQHQDMTDKELSDAFNKKYADEVAAINSMQERGNLSGMFEYYQKKQKEANKNGEKKTSMFKYNKDGTVTVDPEKMKDNGWDSEEGFIKGLQDNYGMSEDMARAMAADYGAQNADVAKTWSETGVREGLNALFGGKEGGRLGYKNGRKSTKGFEFATDENGNVTSDKMVTTAELESFYNQHKDVLGQEYDDAQAFIDSMRTQMEGTGVAILNLEEESLKTATNMDELGAAFEKAGGSSETFNEYLENAGRNADGTWDSLNDGISALEGLGLSTEQATNIIKSDFDNFKESYKGSENALKDYVNASKDQWDSFESYMKAKGKDIEDAGIDDWSNFLNSEEAIKSMQDQADIMAQALTQSLQTTFADSENPIEIKIELPNGDELVGQIDPVTQSLTELHAQIDGKDFDITLKGVSSYAALALVLPTLVENWGKIKEFGQANGNNITITYDDGGAEAGLGNIVTKEGEINSQPSITITATDSTAAGIDSANTKISNVVNSTHDAKITAKNDTSTGISAANKDLDSIADEDVDIKANNKTSDGVTAANTTIEGVEDGNSDITATNNTQAGVDAAKSTLTPGGAGGLPASINIPITVGQQQAAGALQTDIETAAGSPSKEITITCTDTQVQESIDEAKTNVNADTEGAVNYSAEITEPLTDSDLNKIGTITYTVVIDGDLPPTGGTEGGNAGSSGTSSENPDINPITNTGYGGNPLNPHHTRGGARSNSAPEQPATIPVENQTWPQRYATWALENGQTDYFDATTWGSFRNSETGQGAPSWFTAPDIAEFGDLLNDSIFSDGTGVQDKLEEIAESTKITAEQTESSNKADNNDTVVTRDGSGTAKSSSSEKKTQQVEASDEQIKYAEALSKAGIDAKSDDFGARLEQVMGEISQGISKLPQDVQDTLTSAENNPKIDKSKEVNAQVQTQLEIQETGTVELTGHITKLENEAEESIEVSATITDIEDNGEDMTITMEGDSASMEALAAEIQAAGGEAIITPVEGDTVQLEASIDAQDGRALWERVFGNTDALESAINAFQGKVVTITVEVDEASIETARGKIASLSGSSGGKASGQNNYNTKYFADGNNRRDSYRGLAVVGELGPELMIHRGEPMLVGMSGRQTVYVEPEDIIYTAGQTRNFIAQNPTLEDIPGFMKGYNIPGFSTGYNRITWGSKSPGTGQGGGGGAKSRSKDFDPERYHYQTRVIADLNRYLERMNKLKDHAYGTHRVRAIQNEIEATRDLIKANEDLLKEAEKYLAADQQQAIALGAKIDNEGNIINWDELQERYARVAAESEDEDTRDAAKRNWKLIQQYEETVDKIHETYETLDDLRWSLSDLVNEELEAKVEIKIDMDDKELELLDYYLDKIQDNIYKTADAFDIVNGKLNVYNDQINTYKDVMNDLLANARNAQGDAITGLTLDSWLAMSPEQRDALDIDGDLGKKLEEYSTEILNLMENIQDLKLYAVDALAQAFNDLNDNVQESIDIFNHYENLLSSIRDISDLQGMIMNKDMQKAIDALNQSMIKNTKNNIQAQQNYYIELQANANAIKDQIARTTDWEIQQALQEQLNNIESLMRDTQETLLSLWQDGLSKAQEMFQSAIDNALKDYEKSIAGIYSNMDNLKEAYERQQTINQEYVDDYERLYRLSKLQRRINSDLDTAAVNGNHRRKDTVALLQKVENLQVNGQQMSEYDLELLEKQYEYEKALADLEDLRNAKQTVRLQRDRNGNWGYVYTAADSDDLAKQEQAVEDKLYEWQSFEMQSIEEFSSQLFDLQTEYGEKLADIMNAVWDSDEDRDAAIERLDDWYNERLIYLNKYLDTAFADANSTIERAKERYKADSFEIIDTFSETTLGMVNKTVNTTQELIDNLNEAMTDMKDMALMALEEYTNAIIEFNILVEQSNDLFAEYANGQANSITKLSDEQLDIVQDNINNMAETLRTGNNAMLTSVEQFNNDYYNKFYGPQGIITTNEVFLNQLQTALDYLNRIDFLIDSPEKIGEETTIINDFNTTRNSAQEATRFDSGGYTGSWGSYAKWALLDQKEQIFNADDTTKLLDAANILRTLDLQAGFLSRGLGDFLSPLVKDVDQTIEQDVHITAEFPNVVNHSEIEEAFNNLANRATQYANRKVG